MQEKNIILCGFMGCGKSTLGKMLAQKLNMEFLDIDKIIEDKQNLNISEIFESFGKDYFRKLESATVNKICKILRFYSSNSSLMLNLHKLLLDGKSIKDFKLSGEEMLVNYYKRYFSDN